MAKPQWATPARQQYLAVMGTVYKGRCLKGHRPCYHFLRTGSLDHFVHTFDKVEVTSGPITAADVRAGRAVVTESHNPKSRGMGRVDLAQVVSGGDAPRLRWDSQNRELPPVAVKVMGPKRVTVQHEELSDLYGVASERLIDDWKQTDREGRSEQQALAHELAPTGERGQFIQFSTGKSRRRNMDPIELEKHVANRPNYYLLGYGVDGQMRRFAKVRIPGSSFILHVDVSESLQEVSQRKRKWLNRQGIQAQAAEAIIEAAVAQWWAS